MKIIGFKQSYLNNSHCMMNLSIVIHRDSRHINCYIGAKRINEQALMMSFLVARLPDLMIFSNKQKLCGRDGQMILFVILNLK